VYVPICVICSVYIILLDLINLIIFGGIKRFKSKMCTKNIQISDRCMKILVRVKCKTLSYRKIFGLSEQCNFKAACRFLLCFIKSFLIFSDVCVITVFIHLSFRSSNGLKETLGIYFVIIHKLDKIPLKFKT